MLIYKSIQLVLTTISILLVTNSAYSGDIYKWTDADGNVHFGDKPDNKPAQLYNVPKNNSANISSTNEERAKKRKKLLDSFDAQRRSKEEQRATKRKNSKTRKYNCQVSKDRLIRYQRASRIYSRNDVGEKVFLDDQQRQHETSLMKQQINKWCK